VLDGRVRRIAATTELFAARDDADLVSYLGDAEAS